MALTKSIVKKAFGQDVVIKDAYIKVESIAGSKQAMSAVVQVKCDHEVVDVLNCSFLPDLDGDNFIKQAYKHLKTLPEFSGAIDC
jgi:hypothetical protein